MQKSVKIIQFATLTVVLHYKNMIYRLIIRN